MANPNRLKLLFSLLFFGILVPNLQAQEEGYGFSFAPDLWYNDVDGPRIGIRVLGEVDGTFKDGPHRLDAGVWLGTWFPKNPISYYASLTEPIAAISDFGNEGSIQLISSVRTGYSQHRIQLNKRWQPGFDEYAYKELAIYFSQEKLIDDEYRPYPQLWNKEQKSLLGLDFTISENPEIGPFLGYFNLKQNVNAKSGYFTVGTIELQQRINLADFFKLRLRVYGGVGSDNASPEYRFFASMGSSQNWLKNGTSRAKGTIPQPWIEAGSLQIGGGANLRGYLNKEIDFLSNGLSSSSESVLAFNMELEFPNPIDKKLQNISIVGDLVSFRSYLFFDVGRQDFINPTTTSGNVSNNTPVLADAGTGFQLSVNIPDYLGKDRGVFIRYDIPFWLSDVSGNGSNFSFRQLIGIGAIFSF